MPISPRLIAIALCTLPLLPPPARAEETATAKITTTLRALEFAFQSADGQPLREGAKFHLFDINGEVAAAPNGLPLADGRVRTALPPGRYDGWIEATDARAGKIFRGLEVANGETATGAQRQRFDLIVPAAATVQGRLTLPDQKTPAAGYVVAVQSGTRPPDNRNTGDGTGLAGYARGAREAYARTTVGADGAWTLPSLAPGPYSFDVFQPGQSAPFFTLPAATLTPEKVRITEASTVPQNGWEWLFDGQLRHGGAPSKFAGQGAMTIKGERLMLGEGTDLTGVTWTQNLPRENYEISLDALRAKGKDFFCGLTFPVGDAPLSFIVGGWGGTVVGISSLNGMSAEENETTKFRSFDNNRWYRIRLRVTRVKVEAWIDDEPMVNLLTTGKKLSIRFSVEPSQPLGIATWRTEGWLRDVRLRRLDAAEVAAIEKAAAAEAIP